MTDATQAAPAGENKPTSKPVHPVAEFWFYFKENKGAVVGLAYVVFLVLVAILADVIAPHSAVEQYRDALQLPPVWVEGGRIEYLLGTDATGRDILSRIIYGSRYSLLIGAIVAVICLTGGIVIGMVAAFLGGVVDTIITRLMDIILAVPSLLLALVVVAIIGPGLENVMIAVAIVYIPHFVRLTRASAMSELSRDYVTASRVAGAGPLRLMFNVVLPNCMAPLIVQATLAFSTAILDAAALGFLGLGAQPPLPEWGTMLADSREFVTSAWWIVTFPGLAILITVLAINIMGDGLRDALDPRLKRS